MNFNSYRYMISRKSLLLGVSGFFLIGMILLVLTQPASAFFENSVELDNLFLPAVIKPDALLASAPTPKPTATPTPEPTQPGPKVIRVSISQQHLFAYESGTLVFSFAASTGANDGTAEGNFTILDKENNAWSSSFGFWMPYWMGIYWVGGMENGFHGLPVYPNGQVLWQGLIGQPVTYGCVVLTTSDMQKLYDWATVGTQVIITH